MTDSTSDPTGQPSDEAIAADAPATGYGTATRGKLARPKNVSVQPLTYTLAIVLSSLVIPLPIFVGRLVEAILDTTNPANVDVTQGLAYLGPILGWSFASLGVLLVAIVVVFVTIYRRERTLDVLKLPLMILALQVVLGVLILLFNAVINGAAGS
jgi:hypothetical protein